MMRIKDFYAIIEQGDELDASMLPTLENLVNRFPVFQAGLFIYLKCLYIVDSPKFVPEQTRLTPFIHDRRALFYFLLKGLYSKFKVKGKDGKQLQDRTSALINAFFDDLGGDDNEINELLGDVMNNTSMASLDYFSFINNTTDKNKEEPIESNTLINENSEPEANSESKLKNQDLIDKFISDSHESMNILPDFNSIVVDLPPIEDTDEDASIAEERDEDFFFTQTLVDIYIKQKKYDRAYEIIKRLNLNNSEKNIYFADQMSFLEKQIQISNNK